MAASAETEKDRGGGGGSGPRDARPRLSPARPTGPAPPDYKAQPALRTPLSPLAAPPPGGEASPEAFHCVRAYSLSGTSEEGSVWFCSGGCVLFGCLSRCTKPAFVDSASVWRKAGKHRPVTVVEGKCATGNKNRDLTGQLFYAASSDWCPGSLGPTSQFRSKLQVQFSWRLHQLVPSFRNGRHAFTKEKYSPAFKSLRQSACPQGTKPVPGRTSLPGLFPETRAETWSNLSNLF